MVCSLDQLVALRGEFRSCELTPRKQNSLLYKGREVVIAYDGWVSWLSERGRMLGG